MKQRSSWFVKCYVLIWVARVLNSELQFQANMPQTIDRKQSIHFEARGYRQAAMALFVVLNVSIAIRAIELLVAF